MRRLNSIARGKEIAIDFEGESIPAFEGEPVACALLAAGEKVFARSIKYHRPRGPFCFEGACSQCLMRVDATPNLYTCQLPAKIGMRIERQNAYPTAKVDLFRAIDWMFPKGLDHHEMFAGVPVAEQVMQKVARHLAGLGLLPEDAADAPAPAEEVRVPVAIVGGGPAGLGAAAALKKAGVLFQLFEREPFLGGRLAIGAPEPSDPKLPLSSDLGGEARIRAAAVGLYSDAGGRFLAVVVADETKKRLLKVYGKTFLLAVGGNAPILPFENNDLPGIFSGRAVSRLIRRHGIVPGEQMVLVGTGSDMYTLATFLEKTGVRVGAILDVRVAPGSADFKAHGQTFVRAVYIRERGAQPRTLECDCVAVCLPLAPSFELARQAGARVDFDPTRGAFAVACDDEGRTSARGVFVAGDMAQLGSAEQQWFSGERAARTLAEELT